MKRGDGAVVGPGPADRAAQEMRAAVRVGGEGSLPKSQGDPRRGKQRPTRRRPRHRAYSISLPVLNCREP